MTEKAYTELLYTLPDGVGDDDALIDLDRDQIPWARVPALIALMDGRDEWLAFEAARLLCHWGGDEGVGYLTWFVCERAALEENWMPHRLWGYDETYRFALDAFVAYWAYKSTYENGERARAIIFRPIERIVALSGHSKFDIRPLFRLVGDEEFVEYLPCLKQHFIDMLVNADDHYWKIVDCAHLLAKSDPAFVDAALCASGKKLSDFAP